MAEIIDVTKIWQRTDDDPQLLTNIVRLFREEYPPLLEVMKCAIGNGDGPALQQAAHKVKGSVVIFGARGAIDAAEQVEALGQCGSLGEAFSAVSNLESRIDEVVAALEGLVPGVENQVQAAPHAPSSRRR